MNRVQVSHILADLKKKIVLLVGPRQTGKTWISKSVMSHYRDPLYLNFDQLTDRQIIIEQSWLDNVDLLILDELHKMEGWKNYLKGLYDTKPTTMHLLVTGSARLDIFDRLGDSLAGRYFRHRLLPLSSSELKKLNVNYTSTQLIERGGFPEPFLAENDTEAQRWRMQYMNSMLSTDVFEFDKIQNIKAIQLIFKLLQNRVGSPISLQALSEDVKVAPTTVKKYIQILEALFLIFIVTPFSNNIARSVLKEPKIYFFDNGMVEGDLGARYENYVALSLLKHCYAKVDYAAENYQLQYIRTKDGKEVDFAITKQEKIEALLEVKHKDKKISSNLLYFCEKYQLPGIQLVRNLANNFQQENIKVLKGEDYLSNLYL